MKYLRLLLTFIYIVLCGKSIASEILEDYPIKPLSFTNVKITDNFWQPRIETNISVTIPHILEKCEESGRVDKFVRAAKVLKGEIIKNRGIRSYPFDDADVYKAIEAASYALAIKPNIGLMQQVDDLIEKIAAAQEPDGYLYTARTINPKRPHSWAGKNRWEKVEQLSHELYNAGHIYEAGIAYYKVTGKRKLLDVAIKNADLLCNTFGPGKINSAPGHQAIEAALVKLYRVTKKPEYLKLAKFFLDTRGPGGNKYSQAHLRPVDQSTPVGHTVRAMYMYVSMADIAILSQSQKYKTAINRLWENFVRKKNVYHGWNRCYWRRRIFRQRL